MPSDLSPRGGRFAVSVFGRKIVCRSRGVPRRGRFAVSLRSEARQLKILHQSTIPKLCVCLRSRDVPGGVGSRLLPVLPLPTTFRTDFRDNFRNNHRNDFRHDFDINFGNNFGHNFGNMFRFGCDLCNNSGQVSTERPVLVLNNSAQASTERSVLVLKLLPGTLS